MTENNVRCLPDPFTSRYFTKIIVTVLKRKKNKQTHKHSLHFIEDDSFKGQGCLGVFRILMF